MYLRTVTEELKEYSGKKAFFQELNGNNGDHLIKLGSLAAIERNNITIVKSPDLADLIVINGGGGMTDMWGLGFKDIKKFSEAYPTVPLFVFPSSFLINKTDFPSLFENREAPAYVYAREKFSLDILRGLELGEKIFLGLDNDMAFQLSNTKFLLDLKKRKKDKYILIVERDDPESNTSINKVKNDQLNNSNKRMLRDVLPNHIQNKLRKNLVWPARRILQGGFPNSKGNTAFTKEWISSIKREYPQFKDYPVVAADISHPSVCNFQSFSRIINESAVVVSTRLHVAILAALLDKPTYVKTGSYHKIKGIYEYSLVMQDNVHLIE